MLTEGYRSGHNGADSKSCGQFGTSILKTLDFTRVPGHRSVTNFLLSLLIFSPTCREQFRVKISWRGIEAVITGLTRNQFALQRARGFESHPLRHPTRLKRRFQAGFRVFGRCGLPGKFHMTRMFSERKPTPLKPWCDKTFRVFGSICQQMRRCQVPGNFYLCIFCQERKPIPLKPWWDKAFRVFGRKWEIEKRRIGHSIRCARKADYVFIPSPESIASAEEILD